jgi:hypothetical protein
MSFYGWAQISQNGNYVSFWRGTYLLNVTFELYAPNILILEKKVYERLIVQKQFKSVAMQKLLEYQHPPRKVKGL